jgi:hypothetical protein
MALEEYLESEVAVAVAATAVALSPRARRLLRRGAVYGVAGALKTTDVVTAAARGVARGVAAHVPATETDAAPPVASSEGSPRPSPA